MPPHRSSTGQNYAALRQRIGDRLFDAACKRQKTLTDTALAALLFVHQAIIPALRVQGVHARPYRRLAVDLPRFVRYGVGAWEAKQLGDSLDAVIRERESIPLQIDLVRHLRRHGPRATLDVLDSKAAFASACAAHGLPHPTAILVPGGEVHATQCAQWPAMPLFLKPDKGNRARDVAVLDHAEAEREEAGEYVLHAGKAAQQTGPLPDLVRRHAKGRDFVVQPLLENHHILRAAFGRRLMTLRVVTGKIAGGDANALSALAEIALDEGRPLAEKHLILPVDLSGGHVIAPAAGPVDKSNIHPLTGRDIGGQAVPEWRVLKELAERTHDSIAPDLALVGWDLAVTEGGPILIEGNAGWRVSIHYRNKGGTNISVGGAFYRCMNSKGGEASI